MLGFYCKDCKKEFDAPKKFSLPKIRNPKETNDFYVCPKCGSSHWTEVVDGVSLDETENENV